MKDCVQYLRECGIDCPIYCGFTLAINGATEEEVNELFAMAEEAGGTVWQKPQWKDWGGMEQKRLEVLYGRNRSGKTGEEWMDIQDIFLIRMDIHGKLHTHHF